jgi:hypothetical protein
VAVNISADHRWIVSDSMDGVIRWRRTSDGRAMISLIPRPASSDWVAWSDHGYFSSTPGAEDLVGWVVNRGIDHAADFYPLSRFADAMRRPDLLAKVLDTQDDGQALVLANAESDRKDAVVTTTTLQSLLPPVLELVSAPTRFSTDAVTIGYRVQEVPGAPMLGQPRVKVNGQWRPVARAVVQKGGGDLRSVTVTGLPPRDSTIELYASNRIATSTPLVVSVRWDGRATLGPGEQGSATSHKPRLFVLAIGISQYRQTDLRLSFADQDARRFLSTMSAQQGRRYSQVITRLLTNGDATGVAIKAALAWFKSKAAHDDIGMIFIAGHGFETPSQDYVFAPTEFDPLHPLETGVDYRILRDALVGFSAIGNRAVVLVDTCYAGGALGRGLDASNGATFTSELGRGEYSVVALAAANGKQLSFEDAAWGDGAFTKAILEGVADGKADPEQLGVITMLDLGRYVSKRVPVLTNQRQEPVLMMPAGGVADFPIATR